MTVNDRLRSIEENLTLVRLALHAGTEELETPHDITSGDLVKALVSATSRIANDLWWLKCALPADVLKTAALTDDEQRDEEQALTTKGGAR